MSQIRGFSARAEAGRGIAGTMRAAAMVISMVSTAMAQTARPAPNSDAAYQALRNGTLSGEAVSITNLELKRDAATFRLHSGTVCFVAPVEGKVTGAVFVGEGGWVLDPPQAAERNSLRLLTKEDEFSEKFERMVLRFTDSTYDDIKRAGAAVSGGCDTGPLKEVENTTRHKLKSNVEARILEEVLSPNPRPYFLALSTASATTTKSCSRSIPTEVVTRSTSSPTTRTSRGVGSRSRSPTRCRCVRLASPSTLSISSSI
jgi:hypothetical protein